MAVLDPRSDAVVIRVVYDGAPMAGKTTSVSALGRGLGADVHSPAEVGGRTLYFDWLDYTGGLFEGHRIRCQIISVPGQATLAPRRRRLLESADAIVFVGDSTPAGFHADRGYLDGLYRVLSQLKGPPVGVVLQANKRDHAHAVPIGNIRSMLEEKGMRIGVIESVATDGTGIREAFVFAVRLALDRVRELMRTGELRTAAPDIDSAKELLDDLKRTEDGSMEYAAASGLVHTRLSDVNPSSIAAEAFAEVVGDNVAAPPVVSSGDHYEPAPPNERVGSGMVWPPVDGRSVLQELGQARIELTRSADGGWTGAANGRWRIESPGYAVYGELEEGRSVLVKSARVHAANSRDKSMERCVVLAGDGRGKYRLWQIVRIP
jgi:signal recognition particle receptor subunit beta